MNTNDISIWYMNYSVNNSSFPASINQRSSRVEYPSVDTVLCLYLGCTINPFVLVLHFKIKFF